jgi:hypothetical protein
MKSIGGRSSEAALGDFSAGFDNEDALEEADRQLWVHRAMAPRTTATTR